MPSPSWANPGIVTGVCPVMGISPNSALTAAISEGSDELKVVRNAVGVRNAGQQVRILERQQHQRVRVLGQIDEHELDVLEIGGYGGEGGRDDRRTRCRIAGGSFERRERQRSIERNHSPVGARRRNSWMVRWPNCEMRRSVITIRQGRLAGRKRQHVVSLRISVTA